MLRASAEARGEQVDMRGVGHVTVDSGVPGDAELGALADAAVLRDRDEMEVARARSVEALGEPATVRALAVVGNFEMMNRVAEGSGIPIAQQAIDRNAELIEMLGIGHFVKEH